MKKAIFLDRDGVINQKAPEGDYIIRWEDVRFLDGVAEGVAKLHRHGFTVIVVSNQRCVSKGMISPAELEILHARMLNRLAESGAVIDHVYYCPHEINDGCQCRKPQPGMLMEAAENSQIDLHASWMVGDSEADIEAGRAAGCKTAHITAQTGNLFGADLVAPSLFAAAEQIIRVPEV